MTWLDEAALTLADDSEVGCDAGHFGHARRLTQIDNGTAIHDMMTFAADEYADTNGYCMGDDDVSRTLALYGRWEPAETEIFRQAIAATDGVVIDFGSQIGWYTLLALASGREVLAVEAVQEHEELTRMNATRHGFASFLHQSHAWIDDKTQPLSLVDAPFIAIAKVDLEGNDRYAIAAMEALIEVGYVRNILLEISPTFNDSYPALLRYLVHDIGYKAAVVNPWRVFNASEIDEVVGMYPQVDVILAMEPWWT